MLILSFESSAKSASVALCKDGILVAQAFQNSGLTHSCTLLPMARDMLKNAGISLEQVDAVAVAHGPGSFTGIRIGVAAVKGLCWGADLPAIGVSTLEAIAWNGMSVPESHIICSVMDARRNQIYNALFQFRDGKLFRLCPDRAISLEELTQELKELGRPVCIIGDGASVTLQTLQTCDIPTLLLPEPMRQQTAWGVAMAAADKQPRPAQELLPVYLRLSQAERERQARIESENNK